MHPCLSHILTTNLFSHTTLNPLFVRWGVSHTLPKKKKGRTGLAASEHLLGLDGATPPGLLYLYISFGYDCRARSLLPRWAWVSHTLVGPLTPTQKKTPFSTLSTSCSGLPFSRHCEAPAWLGRAMLWNKGMAMSSPSKRVALSSFFVPAERASGFTCFRGHSGARLLVSFWVSHSDLTGSCAE